MIYYRDKWIYVQTQISCGFLHPMSEARQKEMLLGMVTFGLLGAVLVGKLLPWNSDWEQNIHERNDDGTWTDGYIISGNKYGDDEYVLLYGNHIYIYIL